MFRKQTIVFLKALKEYKTQIKVYTDFLPNFKTKNIYRSGIHYLLGNYKIPSTISGRPTSNNPNLLNLPSSGTPLAKPIKKCFVAPKGRCLLGADYQGQELMANCLITNDPNMVKEFASGIDGHSARAVKYFPEKLPKKLIAQLNFIHKHGDKKKYYQDGEGNLIIKELE